MLYVGSRVQQETPEEGWRTYQPNCCEYNNKDEDNSLKILNDKNSKGLCATTPKTLKQFHKNANMSIQQTLIP